MLGAVNLRQMSQICQANRRSVVGMLGAMQNRKFAETHQRVGELTRAGVTAEKLALLPKSAELHGSANGVDSKALAEVLSSKSAENWCFAAFAIVGALAASVVTAEKLALLPKSAELHGFSNSTDYKALTKMASSKSAELSDIDHDAPPNLGAQAAKVQK